MSVYVYIKQTIQRFLHLSWVKHFTHCFQDALSELFCEMRIPVTFFLNNLSMLLLDETICLFEKEPLSTGFTYPQQF